MMDGLAEWIAGHLEREAVAREEVCTAALRTGWCGVLETRSPTGVTFEVSPSVPFGHLYVYDGIAHVEVGD
jgi:hypothetical protein